VEAGRVVRIEASSPLPLFSLASQLEPGLGFKYQPSSSLRDIVMVAVVAIPRRVAEGLERRG
jgi:hypothetical protein